MPSTLRVGSEVSSITSKTARLLDPPPGKKRRVRERVFGVITRSLENGKWEVKWESGEVEAMPPSNLKMEAAPTDETRSMIRVFHRRR